MTNIFFDIGLISGRIFVEQMLTVFHMGLPENGICKFGILYVYSLYTSYHLHILLTSLLRQNRYSFTKMSEIYQSKRDRKIHSVVPIAILLFRSIFFLFLFSPLSPFLFFYTQGIPSTLHSLFNIDSSFGVQWCRYIFWGRWSSESK